MIDCGGFGFAMVRKGVLIFFSFVIASGSFLFSFIDGQLICILPTALGDSIDSIGGRTERHTDRKFRFLGVGSFTGDDWEEL